jgi:hypothetical protein
MSYIYDRCARHLLILQVICFCVVLISLTARSASRHQVVCCGSISSKQCQH